MFIPWGVSLVEDNETGAAQREHEAGGKALHDVLAVDSVLHECHRPRVTVLICCGTHWWGFDNDVIDKAAGNQEIWDEDEEKHFVGRRLSDPRRTLELQVRDWQDGEDGVQDDVHF